MPGPSPARAAVAASGLLVALVLLPSGASAGGELLPLRPGMSVVTQAPEYWGVELRQPQTLVVFDTRDPECALGVEPGINWSAPQDWNQMPNATGRVEDERSVTNLGPTFGVAIDDAEAPNVYATTAPVYSTILLADGRVSKIDGTTGAITRIANLPNAAPNVGLGNICFDAAHRQLHVTNFEDGKLYRLALDGTLLSSFDPFLPDDGLAGFAPMQESIWGVATDGDRVYFGTWRRDNSRRVGPDNAVYSIDLDASGAYLEASFRDEFFVVPPLSRDSMPIVDIAFSSDGELMLVGERTMAGDSGSGAHGSRVLAYVRVAGRWLLSPDGYSVGANGGGFFGWNASGGVDVDPCVSDPDCPEEARKVDATGDALIFGSEFAYGLQIFPLGGGRAEDSYIVDLDDETVSQDKTALGDVEVVRRAEEPPIEDSGQTSLPEVVWAVLRARHEGQVVTFHWPSVRPLLRDEHFHLLKTVDHPATAFSHVNGEGSTSLAWTEEDTSSSLQFFDLRVGNRCEDLSEDEYPPSY